MGHNADDFEPLKSEVQQPVAPAMPEVTLEMVNAKLDWLMGFANAIFPKAGQRVLWEDKVTKSGINLEGTAATSPQEGVLLGANFIPTGPGTGTVLLVVRPIGQQSVTVIDSTKVRFLDD